MRDEVIGFTVYVLFPGLSSRICALVLFLHMRFQMMFVLENLIACNTGKRFDVTNAVNRRQVAPQRELLREASTTNVTGVLSTRVFSPAPALGGRRGR